MHFLSGRFKSERKPPIFAQAIAGLVYGFPFESDLLFAGVPSDSGEASFGFLATAIAFNIWSAVVIPAVLNSCRAPLGGKSPSKPTPFQMDFYYPPIWQACAGHMAGKVKVETYHHSSFAIICSRFSLLFAQDITHENRG